MPRSSITKGTPEQDSEVRVETTPVVTGGCLVKGQIVAPVCESERGERFCKVSNTTPWFVLFVTGLPFSKRPLGTAAWSGMLRDKMRERQLQGAIANEPKKGVQDLGLDLEDEMTGKYHRKRKRNSKIEHDNTSNQ